MDRRENVLRMVRDCRGPRKWFKDSWGCLVIVEGIVGNHSEIAGGLLGGRQGGCCRMVRACIYKDD